MAGADRMTIEEVVKQVMVREHGDVVRAALEAVCRELMEGEVSELAGAELGERRPEDRMTHRNGYRPAGVAHAGGDGRAADPQAAPRVVLPSFLEPRRRSEQALLAVIQQAYVCGVSTRRVDQLVESLGLRVSKSEVSRICGLLDEDVQAFRTRPLEGRYPCLDVGLTVGALLFYLALLPSVLRASGALANLSDARQVPLQRRLRRAIRDRELFLHYQPKLDLQTGRIEGVEALLRWRLRDGSTVPPADYIPLVEPTPVMKDLTMHVFELAVSQSAAWAGQGIELNIAVNISACNLREEDLPDRFARLTAAHGRNPASFTLEVTESAMSKSPDHELHTLTGLRARGFKLSIDDFGTGESSLSRIDSIQFQEVKIDRSFVGPLDEQGDSVLVAGIINLAHALGARAVAEGVESAVSARHLTELGCDEMQGFHLTQPLPPRELEQWLRDLPPNAGGHEDHRPLADAVTTRV